MNKESSRPPNRDVSGVWYVRTDGGIDGPFDEAAIVRRIRGGEIGAHHRISVDQTRWVRVTAVFGRMFSSDGADPFDPPVSLSPSPPPPDEPETSHAHDGSFTTVLWSMMAGVVLVVFTAVMASIWRGGDPAPAVVDHVQPGVAWVRGAKRKAAAWEAHGIIVGKNQVVFPYTNESLVDVTVELLDHGRRVQKAVSGEPHVDAERGLAMVGVSLDDEVRVLSTMKGRRPKVDDRVLLVPPATSNKSIAQRWRVTSVDDKDASDERFHARRVSGSTDAEEAIGCPIVDLRGRLIGVAVEALAADMLECMPVSQVRELQQELAAKRVGELQNPVAAGVPPTPPTAPAPAPPGNEDVATSTPAVPAGDQGQAKVPPTAAPPRPPSTADESAVPDRPPVAADRKADASASPASKPKQPLDATTSADDILIGLGKIARQAEAQVLPLPELPEADAKRYGDDIREQLTKDHPPSRDRALVQRLTRMVNQIVVAMEERPDRFTVTVVEDEEINAFAFVGRNIGINTGFVEFAAGDSEMEQFVLAHEVGHIVLGHTDMAFRRAMLSESILPGSSLGTMMLQSLAKQTAYGQSDEADADCFAVRCLEKIGSSPRGAVRFFDKLRQRRASDEEEDSAVHALFRDHPSDSTRVRRIENECM
jgi:hypothetical protein